MQIEPSLVLEIVVVAGALLGFAWRYNLHVEKKIAAVHADCQAKIDLVRSECARREDIQRIEAGVSGVHKRIDELFALQLKQARHDT